MPAKTRDNPARSTANLTRGLAYLALAFSGVLAVFQLLLALGAPLGAAAWGGAYRVLPAGLRVGSAVSALVFVAVMALVLERLGVLKLLHRPRLVRRLLLGLGALFALSAVANLASSSLWERYTGFPAATVLSISCLRLGLEGEGFRRVEK